jgi:hypothetical protein
VLFVFVVFVDAKPSWFLNYDIAARPARPPREILQRVEPDVVIAVYAKAVVVSERRRRGAINTTATTDSMKIDAGVVTVVEAKAVVVPNQEPA